MGTFLRVLTILLLPLTIACLVLGILLFDRREMLKGRTQKLEDTLIKLAPVIELETPSYEEGERPTHTPRDISDCRSEVLDSPDTSPFWDTYKDHLEIVDDIDVMDFKSKENELTLFYKLDPVTGKRAKDINGYNITTGDGTMQPLLDDIIDRAAAQLDRLNETREQLSSIRAELELTITDLNSTKIRLREALVTIVQKNAEIDRLNSTIVGLKDDITRLTATIAELEDTVREKNRQIDIRDEKLADRDLEIKNLKEHIRKLEIEIRRITQPGSGGLDTAIVLKQGVKGTVTAVDNKWKFVIIELSDEFVDELTRESRIGLDLTQLKLPFDLTRPDAKGGEYVTRVRMREANIDEKIGIADILVNWQQLPVQIGDEASR